MKGFSAMEIVPKLSHLIGKGGCVGRPSLVYIFRSQHASSPVWDIAMYLASVVDSVLRVCFLDFHNIASPADMKAIPVVDFLLSLFANKEFQG